MRLKGWSTSVRRSDRQSSRKVWHGDRGQASGKRERPGQRTYVALAYVGQEASERTLNRRVRMQAMDRSSIAVSIESGTSAA